MARIYTYPQDIALQDQDAWIGTNDANLATVQFNALKIAAYLNLGGKVAINGQVGFKYEFGTIGIPKTMTLLEEPSNQPFSDIIEIYVHKTDISGQHVPNFLSILIGKQILISESNNIDNFGHYELVDYSVNGVDPDFYTLSLVALNSNGDLSDLKTYYISSLNLGTDKHYTHSQNIPAANWVISHGLNKKPSVTVVDSGNSVVHGEINFIDANNITISFTGAFSGKAHLN